jgi:hypothetical protein
MAVDGFRNEIGTGLINIQPGADDGHYLLNMKLQDVVWSFLHPSEIKPCSCGIVCIEDG